jgi:hypothetical protein
LADVLSLVAGAEVLAVVCAELELALWERPATASSAKTPMTPSVPGSQFFRFERGKKVMETAFLLVERNRDRGSDYRQIGPMKTGVVFSRCRKPSDTSSAMSDLHNIVIVASTL